MWSCCEEWAYNAVRLQGARRVNWFTGILVFVIVWWMVLFTVLPWGNRPPEEIGEGHADSAPEKPRLWIKALVTTLIAGVIWAAIYWVIASGMFTFREP
jgi:predicted secreted protein